MSTTAETTRISAIAPEGASAWKYADPTEGARWIFDDNEAVAIENVDPSLIVWVTKG